jgi:hypothetical protein
VKNTILKNKLKSNCINSVYLPIAKTKQNKNMPRDWTVETISEFATALGLSHYVEIVDKLKGKTGRTTTQVCIVLEKPENSEFSKALSSFVTMLLDDKVECCDLGGRGCRVYASNTSPEVSLSSSAANSTIADILAEAENTGLHVTAIDVMKLGYVTVAKVWYNVDQVLPFSKFEQQLKDKKITYQKNDNVSTWTHGAVSQIKIPCKVVPVLVPTDST